MEKNLPIGTVVLLKEATKKVMITGYLIKTDNSDKIYDYSACIYPEGYLNNGQNCLFDAEQIDKVYFVGYKDEEYQNLAQNIKEMTK